MNRGKPFFTGSSLLVALIAIVAQSTLLYAIGPTVHAAPTIAPHHVSTARLNPHLHGAAARPVKPIERPTLPEHRDPADKSKTHESWPEEDHREGDHREWEHWRHHWHYRWSYTAWVVLHRGLGSVHGIAYNAAGVPTSGIHLALRRPSGQYIRNSALRHVTYSGANGSFTMTGVRLGAYRVRAQDGKTVGHAAVSVHPGVMSFVSVKL